MVGYWMYKFVVEDEDVCLVDYKQVEETKDAEVPMVSLCFENPFWDEKLNEILPGLNYTSYVKYLKGEAFDNTLHSINYEEVSFNLSNYLLKTTFRWSNGSNIENANMSKIIQKNIYVTFAGFWHGIFAKCFGLELNQPYKRDVRQITNVFRQNQFLDGSKWSAGHSFGVIFHYPNQQLLFNQGFQWFKSSPPNKRNGHMYFFITGIEI